MKGLTFLGFFFILFSFFTRGLQILYIDCFGPFDSIELGRMIGLRSWGILPFVLSYLPFFIIVKSIKFRIEGIHLSRFDWLCLRLFDYFVIIFLLICYVDLFSSQDVPLLKNIDRIVFNRNTEGTVHAVLRDIAPLMTVGMAVSFYQKKTSFGEYSQLSTINVLVMFAYFILTGNRFSIFYTILAFFLFVRSFFPQLELENRTNVLAVIRNSKILLILSLGFIVFLIAYNLYNSFYVIRGYEDVALVFFNRAVLENVGVYQAIYDSGINGINVYKYFSFDPIDDSKSSTMQFLMEELSFTYNYVHQISAGQVFSGGFPEFFFYTLNYYGLLFIVVISLLFRFFLIIVTKVEVRQNIILFLLAFQCVYPFFLFFTSGFIDFLVNPIYFLKIITFFVSYYAYIFYYNSNL